MSITGALSNALTGLTASARAAQVVSSNLSNINTEGYGRREIELGAQTGGSRSGVQVLGIKRHIDQGVLADRRSADAALAHAQTRAGFLSQVQGAIGTPDQPGSLAGRIAAFESSLITAASRPEASERLTIAVQHAAGMIKGFNDISAEIQKRRMGAEDGIQSAVKTLNSALGEIHNLNRQIAEATQRGHDISALQDHRQVVVDRIAELVPVQEIARDNGRIALMTESGAVLVDSSPTELGFTRANVIAPHMRSDNGLLSSLTLDDVAAVATGSRSPVAGGRLAALFEIRDDLAVTAQAQVDALARNLTERFEQPGLDATRAPGDPGLFTDSGALSNPAQEVGLAGRLTLNQRVDPSAGGAAWRLRDGLGASAPGPTGNASLLQRQLDALTDRQALVSGIPGAGAASLAGHAGTLSSHVAQAELTEDRAASFASTRQSSLQVMLLDNGVDSDAETQRLLLIEQAYTANARMIRTLDEMMQTLLRI